jgi:uncharacterized repeat protein (TIGR01451 family)
MKKTLLAVLWLIIGTLPASGDGIQCHPVPQPKPQPGGQFGCSVNLHNDVLAIGANRDGPDSADGTGSVTVCPQGATETKDCQKISPTDGHPGDEFGRSVAVDDNWVIVGAPFANGSGVVYVYNRDLTLHQKLTASDGARGDQFGLTLALSDSDTLIVGAPNNVGTAGSLSGAAYIFHWDGQSWKQGQKLTASDARAFDNFGFSLAIEGNVIVVGAPFHDGAGANSGEAYVFAWDGKTWSQTAPPLTANDAAAGDEYGSAVGVSGDYLVVGARADDVNGMQDAGSTYVYKRQGSSWGEMTHLLGEAAGDRFGVAVSMDGDQLLIGALLHNRTGPESGTAYLYQRQQDQWVSQALSFPNIMIAPKDRFGQAVSIHKNALLVGAYLADPNSVQDAGSAAMCSQMPMPNADLTVAKSGPASAEPGDTITYKLTVTNRGPDKSTGVHLVDTIPAGLQLVPGSLPQYCTVNARKIDCALSDLPMTLSPRFTILCATNLVNHATVRGNERDPDLSNNSAEASTAIIQPSLILTKTGPASAKPQERITYTLTVTNRGPGTATGVHLEDPIPAGLQAVEATLPSASGCRITPDKDKVVCDFPDDLPFPGIKIVNLQFDVLETCLPSIVNQATVSANCEDPAQSNQISTKVDRTADLMISKIQTTPASVQPGDPITYNLTVTNLGPDIACVVTVSDLIQAGLTSPVITPPCGMTGNKLHCDLAELPAFLSQSFSVSFTASAPCPSKITNTVTVSAVPPAADPQPANNDSGPVTTTVDCPCSPPSITKTDGLTMAFSGDTLAYTIVVSNPGKGPVTVSDPFPADLLMVLWCRDSGGPPCVPSQTGPLQDALTDDTATYRVQGMVSPMFTGTLSNTASVTGPCGSAQATDTTEIVFPPGVTVLCKGIDGTQVEGGTAIYTFVLRNGGPAAQMDNPGDEFSDLLPAGLTVVSASASNGTVTLGNPVTWNGAIPVGGMVTITITAMVGAGTKGMTFCNAPTVAFDQDGNGTNESNAVAVPCCFTVPATIPALSEPWLATLALLLALLALRRLRRRAL